MTNEEKAKEIATRWKAKGLPYNAIYDTAIEVMEWKDKQFAKEKKEIDEQWKRLMAESKSIGVDLLQRKDEQREKEKQQWIDKAMKVICNGCAQKAECEFNNWKTCSTKDELIKAIGE